MSPTEGIGPFVEQWVAEREERVARKLSKSERREVHSMALGFSGAQAAEVAGLSPETIRARRKRIYRVLDVPGHTELVAAMLTDALCGKAAQP